LLCVIASKLFVIPHFRRNAKKMRHLVSLAFFGRFGIELAGDVGPYVVAGFLIFSWFEEAAGMLGYGF
jgi:hypothetical protein